jgi:hypothetical protein
MHGYHARNLLQCEGVGSSYKVLPGSVVFFSVWLDVNVKLIKNFGKVARMAMQQRSSFVPYYYGLVRNTFDTGLSPIFPMYYNFPQFNNAYLTDPKVLHLFFFFLRKKKSTVSPTRCI